MAYKKWVVSATDKVCAQNLAAECDVDPFVALIASSRGYTDPADLEQLLSDEPIYSSPYELPDMQRAVDAINTAIEQNHLIAVFGDYDCDGITSTALLYSYLKNRGVNCIYYIPDRMDEGYGMTASAIDKLSRQGVRLIITVDNGISCYNEVEYAKELGIGTVVTDHHLPPEIIPDALAVVDPHLKNSAVEFKEISGVFVAFKLVCALENAEPEQLAPIYSDLVAIGLIADVMPLVNENRDIVKQGLYCINNTSKMGIIALLNSAGIKRGDVSTGKISFGIAPRINAAGRMDSANIALELLLCEDFHESSHLAERLEQFNNERQKTEQGITNKAIEIIEKQGLNYNRVIVVADNGWHKGVVGIVASRLVERYGKPAIVLSVDQYGEASGSGRSIEGFSLYEAIKSCEDILIRFGGHELAAGLTLNLDDIDLFRDKINKYADTRPQAISKLVLDCKLNPAGMTVDLADAIKDLEPFGVGNPTPVFGVYGLTLRKIQPIGQNRHSKLLLYKGENALEALAFGVPSEAVPFSEGDIIDIAVTLDVNEYNSRRTLSVVIKNWRKHGVDDDKLFEEIFMYDRFADGMAGNYIVPTREDIGIVFRRIGSGITQESLRQGLIDNIGYFKTMVSVDILSELGLINKIQTDNTVKYSMVSGKKSDLSNSEILKQLKGE